MSVDWSKPIQTEDGYKARLLCAAVNDPKYPVAVAVTHSWKEYVCQYTLDGYSDGTIPNIINVPPRKVMREVEAWAIIDGEDHEIMLATFNKAIADRNAGTSTVVRLTGTYEVEVEE